MSGIHDTLSVIDGRPKVVIVPPLDRPRVHPATYLESQSTRRRPIRNRLLKCERRDQSIQRIIEYGEESIAGVLDDRTMMFLDRRPAESVMTLQRSPHLLGCPIPQARAPHDVREQKGNNPSPEIFSHRS